MIQALRYFFFVLLTAVTLISGTSESLVHFEGYRENPTENPDERVFTLSFKIQDGWHINSHEPLDAYVIPAKLTLETDPYYQVVTVSYPQPEILDLESLGGKSSVFEDRVPVDIRLRQIQDNVPDSTVISGEFAYQGCDDSVCLIPDKIAFSLILKATVGTGKVQESVSSGISGAVKESEESGMTDSPAKETVPVPGEGFEPLTEESPFASHHFLWLIILVFAGGLALNLTPCVYPLIPVTISFFGSQRGKGNVVVMALLYVAGMALMYSVLGTAAALSGSLFGSLMTNPVVLILLALLMVGLSLSMFGVYEFRLPYKLTQIGGGSRAGYLGSLVMGLTMGIVAAPCIGPFVISLLTYVAASGNPFIGFILFFSMSVGLGLPYIFLAVFSARIDSLPRSGEWLNGVRIFFGLVLIGMAFWFIHPLLPASFSGIVLPLYLILAGVYYSVFSRAGEASPGFRRIKILISLIAVIAGTWLIKPDSGSTEHLNWQTYDPKILQEADRDDRYVMIDFYSDSCVPCKELDAITFRHPDVTEVLQDFTVIKVDLTRGESDLIEKYDIKGFPTIIFLDPDGRELRNLRLLGFEKPEAFLKRLDVVQEH